MQRNDDTIRKAVEANDIDALRAQLNQKVNPDDIDIEDPVLRIAASNLLQARNNVQQDNARTIFNLLVEYGYANNPTVCAEVIKRITCFHYEPVALQKSIAQLLAVNFVVDWDAVFRSEKNIIQMYVHHREVFKFLFLYGKSALVDRQVKNGLTLLQLIAKSNPFIPQHTREITEILFSSNADPTIRDYDDKLTAYQMARKAKNHELAEAIKTYMKTKYKGKISPNDTIENQDLELKGSSLQLPQRAKANIKIEDEYLIPGSDISMDRILGKGGFGTVYKAKWNHNDVAVKMLNDSNSESILNSFLTEAIIFLRLRHPNIILMYGLCDNPQPGIVMEYASRGSLFDELHSNKDLNWNDRIKRTQGIVKGLQYLHAKKIMHRDLKSANVLVSDTGEAKLTDFGLAVVKQESTTRTIQSIPQAVGTLPWMAPELFTEGPTYTFAADIYSVGIILWEIGTRDIPWKNNNSASLIGAVIQGKRPEKELSQETPVIYKKYMKLCWFQEPDKRPQIGEVVENLEKCRP